MALQSTSIFDSDAAGSTESIALQPVAPATSTQVVIVSAFYGRDASGAPIPVPVPTNRKTLTFTMLPGINTLTITFSSPAPQDQWVNIVQGETILGTPSVKNHSGWCSIFLRGV